MNITTHIRGLSEEYLCHIFMVWDDLEATVNEPDLLTIEGVAVTMKGTNINTFYKVCKYLSSIGMLKQQYEMGHNQ